MEPNQETSFIASMVEIDDAAHTENIGITIVVDIEKFKEKQSRSR